MLPINAGGNMAKHKSAPLGSNTRKTIDRIKAARGMKRRDWSFNEKRARRLTSPWVNVEQ